MDKQSLFMIQMQGSMSSVYSAVITEIIPLLVWVKENKIKTVALLDQANTN